MQMHTWPYTIIYKNVYLYVFSSLNLIDRSWGSQLFDIFGMGFTLGVVTNLRLTLLQHGDAQVIYSSPIMKALWSGTRAIIRYNFLPTGITGHISTSQLDSLDAQVGTLMPMGGSMHQIKADLLRSLWRCLTPGGSPKLYIETADSCHFDATSLEMGSKRPIKFCRNLWEKTQSGLGLRKCVRNPIEQIVERRTLEPFCCLKCPDPESFISVLVQHEGPVVLMNFCDITKASLY